MLAVRLPLVQIKYTRKQKKNERKRDGTAIFHLNFKEFYPFNTAPMFILSPLVVWGVGGGTLATYLLEFRVEFYLPALNLSSLRVDFLLCK